MSDDFADAIVAAAVEYDRAVTAIADAIVERVPLAVMDRLIAHPYRWGVVVEGAKHAVIAKLGKTYEPDAWTDGKQAAWMRLARHNNFRWPEPRAARSIA